MKLKSLRKNEKHKSKISKRFRNINIMLFLLTSFVVILAVFFVLQNIINNISIDYARLYSSDTSSAISAYLNKEIALIQKTAHSESIINWFADENNQEKKINAHAEMLDIVDILSNENIYFGIQSTLNEYSVEGTFSVDDIKPYTTLSEDNYDDAWYFECLKSSDEYVLNVDIDKIFQRKLVWINHKVKNNNDTPLGVVSSGLAFAQTAENLLAEYDNTKVRGMIIDENGIVQMDSINLGDEDFLQYEHFYHVKDEFEDSDFFSGLNDYLKDIDGFFESNDPIIIKLSSDAYSYATITPIEATKWSVITFYNSSSLFNITKTVPLLIVLFLLLIGYTVVTSVVSYRLLFKPIKLLISSLSHVNESKKERIYGFDRNDEIGELSHAIDEMFNKAHYDPLTGIYNRRYMEEEMKRVVKYLSRSNGKLSVMMVDIDYFKNYNDTYGHVKGDKCLIAIAETLKSSLVRAEDFVARYGGEEFAIVLPNTNENGAQSVANRLLNNIKALNIRHDMNETKTCVEISIGVTTANVSHTQTNFDFIKRADEALYISKNSGRSKYTFLAFEEEAK